MTTPLNLGHLDIGGGLSANQAWLTDGPIVLISASTRTGVTQNSRLDLAKGMFIDPLPGEPSSEGIKRLTQAVADEGRWRA